MCNRYDRILTGFGQDYDRPQVLLPNAKGTYSIKESIMNVCFLDIRYCKALDRTICHRADRVEAHMSTCAMMLHLCTHITEP